MTRLLIDNARIVDGTGAAPVDGGAVLVEGDTLRFVGRLSASDRPTDDVQVVDAGGRTVIPGLVEAQYAKDIQVFVDVIGYPPLEAIRCATLWGAELMRMGDRIGSLRPGKLADLVIVDGDPLTDIVVLQDRRRLSVMKGGRFVTAHAA